VLQNVKNGNQTEQPSAGARSLNNGEPDQLLLEE